MTNDETPNDEGMTNTKARTEFGAERILQKFLVAQASRLCCQYSVFSRTGETPVPRLAGF